MIEFQSKPPRLRVHAEDDAAIGIIDQRLDRMFELQSLAKSELRKLIFLLDLVVWNGREVANAIDNPIVRKAIESRLAPIEEALQVARKKAMAL